MHSLFPVSVRSDFYEQSIFATVTLPCDVSRLFGPWALAVYAVVDVIDVERRWLNVIGRHRPQLPLARELRSLCLASLITLISLVS